MIDGVMSNTSNRFLYGSMFTNITVVANCDNTEDGSIEASGTLFVNAIKEYDTESPGVILEDSIFSSGKVIITSTEPSLNSSVASLIVYGGISALKDSKYYGSVYFHDTRDSFNLTSGSIVVDGGGSILKNLNIGGVLTLYNSTNSIDSSYGSLISLGGIAIQNTTDAVSLTSGGALTVAGGASIEKTLFANIANLNTISSGNGSITNITNNNLYSINANIQLLTSGTILVDNISSTNLTNTNSSISNLQLLYGTLGNVFITNNNSLNSTITNLYTSIANINNVLVTQGSIDTLTVGNLHVTTNIEYNNIVTNLSTANIISQHVTIENLTFTYGTYSSLYGTDLYATNLTSPNINSIHISTSNLSSFNIRTLNGTIANLLSEDIRVTNLTSNNIKSVYTTTGSLNITGTIPSFNSSTGTVISYGGISIDVMENATSITSGGGLTIAGGASIAKDVYIGYTLYVPNISSSNVSSIYGTMSHLTGTDLNYIHSTFNNVFLSGTNPSTNSSTGAFVSLGGISINNTTDVTNISNGGGLTIAGGASIAKNVIVGETISSNALTTSNLHTSNAIISNITSESIITTNITASNAAILDLSGTSVNFLYGTFGNMYITDITPSLNSTTASVIMNGGLSINNTTNAVSMTSGGALTIEGGLAVKKDVYIGGSLDLNSNIITNVTAPTNLLDVANKYYVDSKFNEYTIGNVSGNFTQGQVIIASTGGNITGYSEFMYDIAEGSLYIYSTNNATSVSQGGSLQVSGGASVDKNFYVGGNAHILGVLDMNNQKITSVAIPTTFYDAANKYYVDNRFDTLTVGNVSGNFTQGQIIVATTGGNIIGYSDFTYDDALGLVSITSTHNSTNLTTPGTFITYGGANIIQKLYVGGGIDGNGQLISNVTAPTLDLDVVNKWYLDERFNQYTIGNVTGNFTQGQVVVAVSGGNITGFDTFTFLDDALNIYTTNEATSLTSGGVLNVQGGVRIQRSAYIGGPILQIPIGDIASRPSNATIGTIRYNSETQQFEGYGAGNNWGSLGGVIDIAQTTKILPSANPSVTDGNLYFYTVGDERMRINSAGNIGIGTSSPSATLTINGDLFVNSGINAGGQLISNATAPSVDLDVVNKWYLDQRLSQFTIGNVMSGGFTQGQVIVAGSGGNVNGFNSFTFDGTQLILYSTENATNLTSGGVLRVDGGITIAKDVFIGGTLDVSDNKITSVATPTDPYDAVNKLYVDYFLGLSNGDIAETTVTLGNNVLIPLDVTNFKFGNDDVSSFEAMAYLEVPELNIYDQWILNGVLKGSTWVMNETFIGDYPSNIQFSIINTGTHGQIQYTNSNVTGTAILRFRANTTSQGTFANITIGSLVTDVEGGGTGQSFFTQGCLIFGNGTDPLLTDTNLTYINNVLRIGGTTDSISTSTGTLVVIGGVGIQKDVNIGGDITIQQNAIIEGGLDMSSNKITSVALPTDPYDAVNKLYVDYFLGLSNGDIAETAVTLGNNVLTPLNVTNFKFNNDDVSSFEAMAYLEVPELNIYDQWILNGVLKGSTWVINETFIGDYPSNIQFSIINTGSHGQIQYTNSNVTGTAILRFRANTTSQGAFANITIGNYVRDVESGGTGQTYFTQGCLIFGNGIDPLLTDIDLTYINDVLRVGGTINSLNTSTGSLVVIGGVGIQKDLNIGGDMTVEDNVSIGGVLDMSDNKITSVSLPTDPYDAVNKLYVDYFLGLSNGDIAEKVVILNNDVTSPEDVTGFKFANNDVSSFEAMAYLEVPELNIYDQWILNGVLKGSTWVMNETFIGDYPSNIQFSIINTGTHGQIQYTNSNLTGTATLRFRANTTSQGTFSNVTIGNDMLVRDVPSGGTGQTYFTQGCLIFGNGIDPLLTDIDLTYSNDVLRIGSTIDSLNSSTGSLVVIGGVGVQKDVNIGRDIIIQQNATIGGILDMSSNKITSVALPTEPYDAVNKLYVDYFLGLSNGDIGETTVTLGNNVLTPLNVTNFKFNNDDVSSFEAMAYLEIPELNIYDQWILNGVLKGSTWVVNETFIGDYPSNIQFSIINTGSHGQIQYTNSNVTGTATLRFRANTTSQGAFANFTMGNNLLVREVEYGGTGQTYFTHGCLIFGNGINPLLTDTDLTYIDDVLTIGSTKESLNASTGSLVVIGGVGIQKDVNIGRDIIVQQNATIGGELDMTSNKITSVALPTEPFDAANKLYVDYFLGLSSGDIAETTVTLGNNVLTPLNVTNFKFKNDNVSSFEAMAYLEIPELNIYDQWILNGILKGSTWVVNETFIGDYPSNIQFSIINTGSHGQIQYTNSNVTGTATLRFRANTTSQGALANFTMGNNLLIREVEYGGTGQPYFTQGCLIFGNGTDPLLTDINLTYIDDVLTIGSTKESLNTSTGSLIVKGGLGVQKDVNIGGDVYINDVKVKPSYGDIFEEQVFSANNNQMIQDDISGFLFNNATVRYFHAFVSVNVTTNMNELNSGYEIKGIQTNNTWLLNSTFMGDSTHLHFYITNTGQIQYTSSNINDWISTTIKFRALTTSV